MVHNTLSVIQAAYSWTSLVQFPFPIYSVNHCVVYVNTCVNIKFRKSDENVAYVQYICVLNLHDVDPP